MHTQNDHKGEAALNDGDRLGQVLGHGTGLVELVTTFFAQVGGDVVFEDDEFAVAQHRIDDQVHDGSPADLVHVVVRRRGKVVQVGRLVEAPRVPVQFALDVLGRVFY